MKKILVQLLLFFPIGANAQVDKGEEQSDSIEVKIVNLPDSTAIAPPIGQKVSMEIGPAGGAIVSDDGKVKLIFPANALTKATIISIQPVENIIPNGNKAYQFEPSGIQFKKPVQLIFHYSDEEEAVCPPELKFMALQNHKGKWEYIGYNEWDSTTKSLKGLISHFSAFVDGNEFELSATEITIKTGKTHQFTLNKVQPPTPGEDELPPLPFTMQRGNRETLWKVNGRTGGNQKHGTISPVRGRSIRATYRAPEGLPFDPVNVTLELNDVMFDQIRERIGRRGLMITLIKRRSNVAKFTCKVKLFAEYKVIVSQDINLNDIRFSDTSTFNLKISLEDRAGISDIHNQLAKLHIKQTECKITYINEANCVGMINVTGIRNSAIKSSASDNFAWAHVFFKPALSIIPVVHFHPCGINKASNITPSLSTQNAFPMWLSFQLKNEKQFISLAKNAGKEVSRPDPEDITATIEPIRE